MERFEDDRRADRRKEGRGPRLEGKGGGHNRTRVVRSDGRLFRSGNRSLLIHRMLDGQH
jgi:hypothetical protein